MKKNHRTLAAILALALLFGHAFAEEEDAIIGEQEIANEVAAEAVEVNDSAVSLPVDTPVQEITADLCLEDVAVEPLPETAVIQENAVDAVETAALEETGSEAAASEAEEAFEDDSANVVSHDYPSISCAAVKRGTVWVFSSDDPLRFSWNCDDVSIYHCVVYDSDGRTMYSKDTVEEGVSLSPADYSQEEIYTLALSASFTDGDTLEMRLIFTIEGMAESSDMNAEVGSQEAADEAEAEIVGCEAVVFEYTDQSQTDASGETDSVDTEEADHGDLANTDASDGAAIAEESISTEVESSGKIKPGKSMKKTSNEKDESSVTAEDENEDSPIGETESDSDDDTQGDDADSATSTSAKSSSKKASGTKRTSPTARHSSSKQTSGSKSSGGKKAGSSSSQAKKTNTSETRDVQTQDRTNTPEINGISVDIQLDGGSSLFIAQLDDAVLRLMPVDGAETWTISEGALDLLYENGIETLELALGDRTYTMQISANSIVSEEEAIEPVYASSLAWTITKDNITTSCNGLSFSATSSKGETSGKGAKNHE